MSLKTNYSLEQGLAGVMIWEVGQDCRLKPVVHGPTTHVRTCPQDDASLLLAISKTLERAKRPRMRMVGWLDEVKRMELHLFDIRGVFPRAKFRRLTMAPVSTLPALGFVDRMQRLGLDFEKEVSRAVEVAVQSSRSEVQLLQEEVEWLQKQLHAERSQSDDVPGAEDLVQGLHNI
eukprot:symbB.v1.2.024278.t2/scaffold2286.1/size83374/3